MVKYTHKLQWAKDIIYSNKWFVAEPNVLSKMNSSATFTIFRYKKHSYKVSRIKLDNDHDTNITRIVAQDCATITHFVFELFKSINCLTFKITATIRNRASKKVIIP